MEANELRIGNYFVGYSNYVQQWEIESFALLAEGVEVDEIIISFIPLTEEWLLKFGFEKSNNNTDFYTFDKDKISIHLKSRHYANGRTYFNSWCIIEKQIEYVHQLQNLYFSLIGKELNLC